MHREELRYGLRCGTSRTGPGRTGPGRTLYHVKLTDTAIRALEAYQKLKSPLDLLAPSPGSRPPAGPAGTAGKEEPVSCLLGSLLPLCFKISLPSEPSICFKGNQGKELQTPFLSRQDEPSGGGEFCEGARVRLADWIKPVAACALSECFVRILG
ncbi:hypothetical protein EYF80_039560 [Liparis tanakae]|uniref:RNA polymerase II elongation factor ELL N-terminal domain-containing protein n=1 Tax=Liparis tanakae TaxID=230148 RepID=A0A4Z2GBD6_9TELE|nr:hypothetical protein EYF80_039560 [Liparis tanakae]